MFMDKEILTMEEAAEFFGVSIKTFIKLLKEEKVPGRKIGREWRFSRQALIEWLAMGDSQAYSAREASEVETKEFFNEVAPDWEELRRNYYDESIKSQLTALDIFDPQMILMDLGTGNGYLARFAAPFVKKVLAVDISGEMLKELRKKARSEGLKNIETIESDGREVPVADGSAGLICANMYLHHIEQPEQAIGEIYRILEPQGTVFLADILEHRDEVFKESMHDIWPGFAPPVIMEWFKEVGFIDVKIQEVAPAFPGDEAGAGERKTIFILTARKS
jgi:excisionase family DNA binding protein